MQSRINNYVVEEPVTRGFYSAIYRARQESLNRVVVLKIVSKAVYQHFKKDWPLECREHAALAAGTPFVAAITDQFDFDVTFAGTITPCHIAVLEDVPGPTLERVLASPIEHHLTPRMAAQIAIDLFEILNLFASRGKFHNDLHARNLLITRLQPTVLRTDGVDLSVRAVAIDLGSVHDQSLSGDHHVGDQRRIAWHMVALSNAVREMGAVRTDMDYRLAGALRGLAEHLTPATTAQRVMTPTDALRALRAALNAVDEPWRQPLSLHRYGDAYNAQALESWHVPELWFDPDDRWLMKTTGRGSQVITGMRGCGKTMLLRALHFHARATTPPRPGDTRSLPTRLKDEAFLGLFASCQKLLNPQDRCEPGGDAVTLPFERLYVAYLRDAVQLLRHLRSIDPPALLGAIDITLRDALRALDLREDLTAVRDEQSFDAFLEELQFRLADGASASRLKMAPVEAFGYLAEVICRASPTFAGKYVLFLLDDVSTRYLAMDDVQKVISQLLFQHPHCAFRITTEAQALHRVLLSLGGSTAADPLRDYEELNLGHEVYRLLQEGSTRDSIRFVSEILRRRGAQFRDALYRADPIAVLGDVSLESIARAIARSTATSPDRKVVYRGLRAVQAACVGDLGDVVKLYEKILQRATVEELPVPAQKQTDCFLEHSASLMHFLNRRDQQKKSLALAFAQASGELLQRSARNGDSGDAARLRQYTKLYVRVDPGREGEEVANALLALLDAGVFVYDGGGPRTKTKDPDPVLQFKLSFRKMLGLASFIGLSDRDRFELSGKALRRWLEHPDQAKSILVDSEAKRTPASTDESGGEEDEAVAIEAEVTRAPGPPGLLRPAATQAQLGLELGDTKPAQAQQFAPTLGIVVSPGSLESWAGREVDTLILARGFEARALTSTRRLLKTLRPKHLAVVRYNNTEGKAIARLVERSGIPSTIVSSVAEMGIVLKGLRGDVIVDASGLWKPYLFMSVRETLIRHRRVGVVHTLAELYYPRNEDLLKLGITAEAEVPSGAFAKLGEVVLMGEAGPYTMMRIHNAQASPERWRALLASASAKNDRLLHLLDQRDYDAARIFVPPPKTPRRRLARAATELVASAADSNVGLIEVDTNDIEAAVRATEDVYNDLYFRSGANVEIGITGSKVHAVAFAALAAAGRVAAAWYVSPKKMDRKRFTKGAGETHCFEVALT